MSDRAGDSARFTRVSIEGNRRAGDDKYPVRSGPVDTCAASSADVTASDLEAYAVKRQAEDACNGTINRELAFLRRAYKLAQRAGKLMHVPHVPMLREANARAGFFDRDQIDAVISRMPDHLKPVVRFGYLTGWRSSEILKWNGVRST